MLGCEAENFLLWPTRERCSSRSLARTGVFRTMGSHSVSGGSEKGTVSSSKSLPAEPTCCYRCFFYQG
jgi:hypothetical protein